MSTQRENRLPRVVIVGGGFGGLQAAAKLGNAPVSVTVVDRKNHHLFQPLLYQVATAGLSPADIAAPIRGILGHQKNTEVMLGEVIGVNPRARTIQLLQESRRESTIAYDYLILATGSTHSYFGHAEWERYAPGLKSIDDATMIRQKILLAFEGAEAERDPEERKRLLTFVIVGGGPTGVELAGALYELSHIALASDFRHIDPKSTKVILIEAGPRVLASFSEGISARAKDKLESFGVEVRTNSRVSSVDPDGVTVGEERIRAHTVLWAAGVVASPAARWLGVESDRVGRAKVLSDLTVPGHPEIFVIGDTATLVQDGAPLPGVAPVALQQARYVAKLVRDDVRGKKARKPFRYRDKGNLATVGRAYAVIEYKRFRSTGFIAWLLWIVVHIYYLIGFRNRLAVVLDWAWAYVTFQRGARLITWETPLSGAPNPESQGGGSPASAQAEELRAVHDPGSRRGARSG